MKRHHFIFTLVVLFVCLYPSSRAQEVADDMAELEGVYSGTWESKTYKEASGELILTVAVRNGQPEVKAVFTGSEYLNEDTLISILTPLGKGVWKMNYKGKKSKISGTGIFNRGRFSGDYKFKKLLWTDRGKWELEKQ